MLPSVVRVCVHFFPGKRENTTVSGRRVRAVFRKENNNSSTETMSENFINFSEIRDLRTAFDLLDRDQDGHVTPEELQFMLRNLGIHVRDELIDDLLREASRTGSGLIDETEFLQWVARIQALKEESSTSSSSSSSTSTTQAADDDLTQDLVAAFRVFDRDGNGYITRDELKSAMDMIGENVTEYQLNEMLELADADKDGRINYEEFARLLL